MEISPNLLAFRIVLSNGKTLEEFEEETGKIYISKLTFFSERNNDGTEKVTHFKIIPC